MIICILAMILLLIVAFACYYCFHKCFYAANLKQDDPYRLLNGEQYEEVKEQIFDSTKRMEDVPFEEVTVNSFDGLALYGRYYHLYDGAPVVILFHGYRSMALRDCAGGFHLSRKLGYNVLVVDQRAHGKSEGHVITLGIWERRDCHSWIKYINERFGKQTPIILSGLSMGAATVILATALPLPNNVICVLADCPYSAPHEILKRICRERHIPVGLAYPMIRFSARFFGGFNLEQVTVTHAAGVSPIPILLLHGEEDLFVPSSMSNHIHEVSNGATKLITFAEAGHGLSYIVNPEEYENAVVSFLDQFPELKEGIKTQIEEEAL